MNSQFPETEPHSVSIAFFESLQTALRCEHSYRSHSTEEEIEVRGSQVTWPRWKELVIDGADIHAQHPFIPGPELQLETIVSQRVLHSALGEKTGTCDQPDPSPRPRFLRTV